MVEDEVGWEGIGGQRAAWVQQKKVQHVFELLKYQFNTVVVERAEYVVNSYRATGT